MGHIGMVAGGSGVTPMLQLIERVLADGKEPPQGGVTKGATAGATAGATEGATAGATAGATSNSNSQPGADSGVTDSSLVKAGGALPQLSLLVANHSEESIMMREEMEALVRRANGRLKVHFVVTAPAEASTPAEVSPPARAASPIAITYGTRILDRLLEAHLPAPSEDTAVLWCGPSGLNDLVARELVLLGHDLEMLYEFC